MRGFPLAADPGTAFPTSGPLTNFLAAGYPSGQSLGASLVVGTLVRNPDQFPNAALDYPFPGTPAYDLFMPGGVRIVDLGNAGSAIGLANFTGGAIAGNDTVVLTFTNLDPSVRYAFRGTAVRNGVGVGTHSGRWTVSSIAGADASVVAGTPGVITSANQLGVPGLALTNGQQIFQSGVNTNGDLVGWDSINPGADGSFSVISKGYGGPVKDIYSNMGPNAGPGATFTNAYGNNGMSDLVNNVTDDSQTFSFRTWVVTASGGVKFEVFTGIGGNLVSDLVNHPGFPNSPAVVTNLTSFDSREFHPTDSLEGYGGRMSGLFIPQTSGAYIFYLNAEDGSALYFNPTGPQAEGRTLIQGQAECCASFAANTSAPQTLTAGQAYYFQALYKEGGGGDCCQVAAKVDTDPTDPNTLLPISAARLGTFVNPVGATVTITTNPVDQVVGQSSPALVVGLEEFITGTAGYSVITGIEGGNVLGPTELWLYSPARGVWSANGGEGNKNSALNSPYLTVTAAGTVSVTFSHRYNFEDDGGDSAGIRWDAGILRVSVNRGAYTTVPSTSITGENYKTDKTIGGNCPPIRGQFAFNGQSGGFVAGTYVTSTADLGTFNVGDLISVQFLGAWDDGFVQGPAPNWEINSVAFAPSLENNSADDVATFTAGATATLDGSAVGVSYQWQRDSGTGFTDIAGATSATYSFLPTAPDDGSVFRCVVRSPGAEATTTEATLTVAPSLTIRVIGDTASIAWPASSTGYVLEHASALLPPAPTVWTPVVGGVDVSGGMNRISVSGSEAGQKFYRLKK